jgi:hypothetical protein
MQRRAETPRTTAMDRFGRESEHNTYWRRKQAAQRALVLERQARIERPVAFIDQLQCDLARLSYGARGISRDAG